MRTVETDLSPTSLYGRVADWGRRTDPASVLDTDVHQRQIAHWCIRLADHLYRRRQATDDRRRLVGIDSGRRPVRDGPRNRICVPLARAIEKLGCVLDPRCRAQADRCRSGQAVARFREPNRVLVDLGYRATQLLPLITTDDLGAGGVGERDRNLGINHEAVGCAGPTRQRLIGASPRGALPTQPQLARYVAGREIGNPGAVTVDRWSPTRDRRASDQSGATRRVSLPDDAPPADSGIGGLKTKRRGKPIRASGQVDHDISTPSSSMRTCGRLRPRERARRCISARIARAAWRGVHVDRIHDGSPGLVPRSDFEALWFRWPRSIRTGRSRTPRRIADVALTLRDAIARTCRASEHHDSGEDHERATHGVQPSAAPRATLTLTMRHTSLPRFTQAWRTPPTTMLSPAASATSPPS